MSKKTTLSHGQIINGADPITVELIQPDSMPTAVPIAWPTAPTITTLARYNEVASTAMRLLAEASTTLARSKRASDGKRRGRADRRYSRTSRRLPLVGPRSPRDGVVVKAYTYTGRTSCLLGHSASKGRRLSSGRA